VIVTVKIQAVIAATLLMASGAGAASPASSASTTRDVLWKSPGDVRSRNLAYGIGGPAHVPHGPFHFVKEDRGGSNPKYTVVDRNGMRWKVKLGSEAQPETAATRIIWAAGYITDTDYYQAEAKVTEVPSELHRGKKWVDPDGTMHGVRFELDSEGMKKIGEWKWKDNPFVGSREWNGLRALMALINNWDVKDVNNNVYEDKDGQRIYMVSDLGATFASPGFAWPASKAKGNLAQYEKARFVCGTEKGLVDFCAPGRSALVRLVAPKEFVHRWKLRWVGRDIPVGDVRWIAGIVGRLSHSQICDAFRAAGYTPEQVEGFAMVLEGRIGELTEL
jgi:hypothetical protein